MPIASQYSVLSEDKKTLILPEDVKSWLKGSERFVVVMENDDLILRKAHSRRSLNEIVTKNIQPLTDNALNDLIHETRK